MARDNIYRKGMETQQKKAAHLNAMTHAWYLVKAAQWSGKKRIPWGGTGERRAAMLLWNITLIIKNQYSIYRAPCFQMTLTGDNIAVSGKMTMIHCWLPLVTWGKHQIVPQGSANIQAIFNISPLDWAFREFSYQADSKAGRSAF